MFGVFEVNTVTDGGEQLGHRLPEILHTTRLKGGKKKNLCPAATKSSGRAETLDSPPSAQLPRAAIQAGDGGDADDEEAEGVKAL